MAKRTIVVPIGPMILIKHDKDQDKSKGGIILPEEAQIHVLTGVVYGISERLKHDPIECPYDVQERVLYDTRHRIPTSLDPTNNMYLIHYEYVYGVVREVGKDDVTEVVDASEEMPNKNEEWRD